MSVGIIGSLFGPCHGGALSCVRPMFAVLLGAELLGERRKGGAPAPGVGGGQTQQAAFAGLCDQHSEGLGLVLCEEGRFLPISV